MSSSCSVVDDYAVLFDGALYIRKVNKNATQEEKRKRRAQYMKRYRTGRKGVKKDGASKKKKNIKKEEEGVQQGKSGGTQHQEDDDTLIARVDNESCARGN